VASPADRGYEIRRAADVPDAAQITNGIVFVGQVVKGGPNVTFTGTAKEILEQVLLINPDYEKEFVTADDNADGLAARGDGSDGKKKLGKRWPTVSCSSPRQTPLASDRFMNVLSPP